VDAAAVVAGIFERALDLGVPADRAVLDGAVDLYEILIDYAAGADVEVADF
jgi:hypothetical protein